MELQQAIKEITDELACVTRGDFGEDYFITHVEEVEIDE